MSGVLVVKREAARVIIQEAVGDAALTRLDLVTEDSHKSMCLFRRWITADEVFQPTDFNICATELRRPYFAI